MDSRKYSRELSGQIGDEHMQDPWIKIGLAARMLQVSIKTLHRAEKEGRITFTRKPGRIIKRVDLLKAPVITLGRAAKRLCLSYTTLLRAANRGALNTHRTRAAPGGGHGRGFRHVSVSEMACWVVKRKISKVRRK